MKNTFLLSTLAILLAGFWFGGISNAEWDFIYNEASWNATYSKEVMQRYYDWADAIGAYPYKEDLWNTVAGRAANWNDIEKDGQGNPIEYDDGYHYTNCERSWSRAKNAAGAKYPWAVVTLPIPFEGTIKFVYDNGEPKYPFGETIKTYSRGFAIESIVTIFGNEFLIDGNENTTFDPNKLVVSLIPAKAKIGETGYDTLTGAIAAAGSNDTIILLEDVDTDSEISISKKITLDLKGHKILRTNRADDEYVIRIADGGSLTINDSSDSKAGEISYKNYSTDGVISAVLKNEQGGSFEINEGKLQGQFAIVNHGIGVINSGTFRGLAQGNVATIHSTYGGQLTINGGVFQGRQGSDVIDGADKEGKVIYAGGNGNKCEYPSTPADSRIFVAGTIIVNGGSFDGRITHSNNGTYVINGGNFDRNVIKKIDMDDSEGKCTGSSPTYRLAEGTFADAGFLPEGYVMSESNGRYIVSKSAPAPVSTPSGGRGGSRSGTTKVSGDSSSTSQTDKTDNKSDDKTDDIPDDTSDEKVDENTEDKTEEQVEEKTEDTNLEEDTQTTQEETPIASQEELQNYEEQSRYDNKGDQQEVLDDGLTREMNNAYEFSHRAGITSMNNASEADMFGPLNRIAMAKMLVNYATNVLGRKPDTSKPVPAFADVDASLEADYGNAVTMAYQLGIMGIGITDFRPFDEVPRGEFGTALSRMLFGLADGQGAYYETHLQKLANEGIIRDSNPDLQELRGYVMIMLMRSAKK